MIAEQPDESPTALDLTAIMNIGMWKSLRMALRYSSVSVHHMRVSINRVN
jgi:hypothetical protein